jgi:polyhydroxyalkanoate synthesis regulator phasin
LVALVLAGLVLATVAPAVALADGPNHGGRGRHHREAAGWGRNELVDTAAEALGTVPSRLVRSLRYGAELSDLAQWRRVQPEELVQTYMDRIWSRIQDQIHLGWMTDDQGEWLLGHMLEQARWAIHYGGGYLAYGWNGKGMMGYGWGYGGLIEAAAEVLGLSPWEIMAELHAGTSLQELAEAQGVDPEEIIAHYLGEVQERLDYLVDQGRLTEEQAQAILEELAEHAHWFLDNSVMMGYGWGYGGLLGVAADVLGISVEELVEELSQGKTLAEIAEEHQVDPQAIVDAFVAQVREALDEAVADGRLTPEQAEAILARVTEYAEWLLYNPFPTGFGYGYHHGMGSGGYGWCH